MAYKVCQTCYWDAGAACVVAAGAGVAGGGAECYCGSALAICPWSRAKYRSACLMLKSKSPAIVHVGVVPCCWGGCAWDEDSRSSCSCWAAAALPAMRARILCSASMSCVEAPSPSRTLAPAPVPAEGWAAEAEGLAGSGAEGGVVAYAAVASAPAKRVLVIQSWILPRGGRQTVGGDRAEGGRRQNSPLTSPPPPKESQPKAPSEAKGTHNGYLYPHYASLTMLRLDYLYFYYYNYCFTLRKEQNSHNRKLRN
jgi:hypothetical protein